MDFEDEYGMYQVLWSRAALERYQPMLSLREPMLIRGRVRTERHERIILTGLEIKRLQQTVLAGG